MLANVTFQPSFRAFVSLGVGVNCLTRDGPHASAVTQLQSGRLEAAY